jgi:4-amino-4-deoxy-L-arabinose transferase-like glycosyltransferase
MKNKIVKYKAPLLVLLLYFCLTLINLLKLPIYNDEAIYIDWGWVETHLPGHLFESLYDAKQPFLMWIFSISQRFIHDPLLAGRVVSVLIGATTLTGIYITTKKIFNRYVAIIASVLFCVTPIFVFYNRLALMEAAVASIGVWSLNALIDVIAEPSNKRGIILGVILGFGFFIKSSSLIFAVVSFGILGFFVIVKHEKKLMHSIWQALLSLFLVDLLLFIQPLFWETFWSNNRYTLTLHDIMGFPFHVWSQSFTGLIEIGFFFITPFIFFAGVAGLYFAKKRRTRQINIFIMYFLAALFLEAFSVRNQNQRYLMPFLVMLVIPASWMLFELWKKNVLNKIVAVIAILIPVLISIFMIWNPAQYITLLSHVSHYSETEYISGQMSGYGIQDTVQYLEQKSKQSLIVTGINLNAGNPESAVDVYMDVTPNATSFHMAASMIPNIQSYDCLSSQYPVYYVSRKNQLWGLDKYLVEEKRFYQPYTKDYSIGIYTLKKDCHGKTFSLSEFYKNGIQTELEIK